LTGLTELHPDKPLFMVQPDRD